MITMAAQFTMRPGKVPGALKLVHAAKAQADAEQPGTLFYLVHRVLDKNHKPTRQLLFYECYRDQAALSKHLRSSSWKAIVSKWGTYFEGMPTVGKPDSGISVTSLERIAGFVHLEAR